MLKPIGRRDFLKGLSFGAAALAAPGVLTAQAASKPNVILVMTDDQGYGDMAAHGNTIIQTPAMDQMHEESVRLTDFHVSPTCSPTRAALMTGHYSNATGVWHTIMGRSILHKDEVTMADVFGANGYRTGFFGKWHLGDNYPSRPQDKGFQEVVRNGGGGVVQTPDYWDNDYFDDTYFHNGKPEKYEGYCTDVWFDNALKFIEKNQSRPFFCYIPTNAPHGPFLVDKKYSDPYAKNAKTPNAAFYGMITNIDENFARLRKRLKALKLEENTILIFLTDNGTAAGFSGNKGFNAGMRGTKGSEYDGGHRVPCFVHWPAAGMTGGRDVPQLAAHVDLLPTLIDLCKLEGPKGVKFDGKSIGALLRAEKVKWPDRTLVVDSQRMELLEKWRKCAVMTQRWRLVNGKELYDIGADPGQQKDLAAANPAVVERLRAEYEKWWERASSRGDEFVRIILGNDKENPSRLTCHDWHAKSVPWNHGHIRAGLASNGFWAVDVERAGEYEFELRRWPQPADAPIEGVPKTDKKVKAIKATKARIEIGGVKAEMPIPQGAKAVTFRLKLKAGETLLQTWFEDGAEESRGAYYAYVTRL